MSRADNADQHIVLDTVFVQQIGLSEAQYALFVQMELAALATSVYCKL